MRYVAGSGDARLGWRRDPPTRQALPAGVHPLAAGRGSDQALLFVPPAIAADHPLLVYFHGARGAPTTSLPHVQAAATEHGCLVLVPSSVAATWDVLVGGFGPDVERVDAALAVVGDHFPVAELAFGGFSDGASYALSIGLANGDLGRAVLAFSPGFMAPPDLVGSPRVWISHGTEDAVLNIDRCARPISRQLRKAGYQVSYDEFAGPHVVRPESVGRAFRWWLDPAGSEGNARLD